MNEEQPVPIEAPLHVGSDDIHAHPRHTGHRWLDLIIALSAISISVISLFVAIEHGQTEKKLVAANSWPFLTYASESDGIDPGHRQVIMRLENNGVGPARVQTVSVMLDGRPIRSRDELMRTCCDVVPGQSVARQVALGLFSENAMVGVLPARSNTTFLAWRQTQAGGDALARLDRARRHLTFKACYCSVLDECWTTDLRSTTTPTPVAACPIGSGYTE